MESNKPGYHLNSIVKGTVGELSKIREELDEATDAEAQGVKVMVLLELADMVGAIEMYLEKHFNGVTLSDLFDMNNVTRRAFKNGHRS